jgi:hypothetical protein
MLEANAKVLRAGRLVEEAAGSDAISLAGRRIGIAKSHFAVPDDIDTANDVIETLFRCSDE